MNTPTEATPGWMTLFLVSSITQVLNGTAGVEPPLMLDWNTGPFAVSRVQLPLYEPLVQVPMSANDQLLQQGLLSLLAFSPRPDQPTDDDVRPQLEYNFPAF